MRALSLLVTAGLIASSAMGVAATAEQAGLYVGPVSGQEIEYETGLRRPFKKEARLTIYANDTYDLSTNNIKPNDGSSNFGITGLPAAFGTVTGGLIVNGPSYGAGQLQFLPNGNIKGTFTFAQSLANGRSVTIKMSLKKQP